MDSTKNVKDENQQYKQKLEGLKKDLPFLLGILEKLRNNNLADSSRQNQLEKMQKLYDLINDESQVLKFETLLKCEAVVRKIQWRMDQQTETESRKTMLPKEPETTTTAAIVNLDDIPVPESPPPQPHSDIEILPIEIPTERCNSPPASPKRDKKELKDHRKHTHHHHHHNQHHHHQHQSDSHEGYYQQHNRLHDLPTTKPFHGSNPFKNDGNRRLDDKSVNYNNNKNKNIEPESDDHIYSPEKAWNSIQNEPKQPTSTRNLSNTDASGSWQKQNQAKIGSVFSRLGEKISESSSHTLQIKVRNDQCNKPTPKPSSLAAKLQSLTATPLPPAISPDLLNKPPLSANDISKLLIENTTNSNSNSNSNTFDYGFGKSTASTTTATTTASSSSPSEPSTFDLIRKKFALLTKGNSSPLSGTSFSSKSSALGSPTTAALSPTAKPTTVVESAAHIGNVNVLPTLRPNDPRLRRAMGLLNSTAMQPQALPLSNSPSHHIPRIVSGQVMPTLPSTVPPSLMQAQPIKVLQQNRHTDNITIVPTVRSPTAYVPTLTPIQQSVTIPLTKPVPLMSLEVPPPPPNIITIDLDSSSPTDTASDHFVTNKTANERSDNILPTRYCDSDENWDSDGGDNRTNNTIVQQKVTAFSDPRLKGATVTSAKPTHSVYKNLSTNQNKTAPIDVRSSSHATQLRYCDSDENWDTDDNACDYGIMQRSPTTATAQPHVVEQPALQRRDSTATPFIQRRNSISFKDASRLNDKPVGSSLSEERSFAPSTNTENPFKRVLTDIKRLESRTFEPARSVDRRSPPETPTAYTRQNMEQSLNSYEELHQVATKNVPPPRRKSISWESHAAQQHAMHSPSNINRFSNPTATRLDNYNNSPTDRFNAKINDAVERSKYLESKKQKVEPPRTYGAYREAKARAEARKKAEEQTPPVTEPTIISSLKPAPIANSTLDNLYRNTNMTSCELPKANIGSFKIPKKQTSVVEDVGKNTEQSEESEKKVDDKSDKNVVTKTLEKQDEEKAEVLSKNSKKTKESTTKADKAKIAKSEKSQEIKEATKVKQTKKATEISKEEAKDKNEDKTASDKNQKADQIVGSSPAAAMSQVDEPIKPKPQRSCFKNRQQKLQQHKEKPNIPTTRDPRLERKSKQAAQEAMTGQELNDQLVDQNAAKEVTMINNSDEVHGSDVEEETATKTTASATAENAKSPTPKEQFEALMNSPIKPRRILTRRCTMIDQASAPEVDKEKLAKANAMLFEDLQAQERKKKVAAESAKAHYSHRRYTGEICYDKTDDNCTVSTQNIISGKRRTRTTVNFNEVQQGIAVFKHKKLPDSTTAKKSATVETPPTAVKVRQKPGPKPKQKPIKSENVKTEAVQPTSAAAAKQIRKRRQTLVEPTPPEKKQKETAEPAIEDEAVALPHVTNIFDSFIQKILHPDTDAEDLINKLRDILSENEVQTLLEVRAAMAKNKPTNSVTATATTTEPTATKEISAESKNEKAMKPEKATTTKAATSKSASINTKEQQNPSTEKVSMAQQAAAAKGKHHKTELDRLHDDIRDMFISEGVLTATGRRMCTFVKPADTATSATASAAKTKADNSVALEMDKSTTTTNSETVNITPTAAPTRKTRSAVSAATATPKSTTPVGRNLRKKQTPQPAAVYKDLNETEISDITTTDMSFNSDITSTLTMSTSNANLDTTTDSSECLAALRDMPKLKPAKPIRLPEEDDLEALMAKTYQTEANNKKKDVKAESPLPIATLPIPAVKSTTLKKRKIPCPKSKKPATDSTDDDDEDEEENMALIKIKQEMLDVTVPYEEPIKFAQKYIELRYTKNKNEIKNINPKWHFQSRYAHVCAICGKRANQIAMHYKKFHREHYSSRLSPSILHQLKVYNTSVSRPILKYAPIKTKHSTYMWLHRCPFCLQFKRTVFKSWVEHYISHTGEHCYECTLCHASSNHLNAIEKHMKERCLKQGGRYLHNDEITLSAKASNITAHVCHLCNYLRLGRSALEFHYVEQHGCDIKDIKNLGYTIVLMDFDNVPFIETLEEADEVEEKLSSQFNGQFYELSELENGSTLAKEVESKQDVTIKKRRTEINIKENKQHAEEEHKEVASTTKNIRSKLIKTETVSANKGKVMPKSRITKKKVADEECGHILTEENAIRPSDEQTTKDNSGETITNPAVTTEARLDKEPSTTPAKTRVSNAFMSTTDDSNDEEAVTTSRLLVNKLLSTNNEVEVSTNSKELNKSSNNAVTMADRLSQRLKEAEEKAVSPTKQQQAPQPQAEQIQSLAHSENAEKVANSNDVTVEIIEEDEEDDGWEDIEIVESAPSANSSVASHSSSLGGKDSKTHKSKLNTLQKFSRFLTAPNAAKSRKKHTKSLKSLMTLLSDANENTEVSNEEAKKATKEKPTHTNATNLAPTATTTSTLTGITTTIATTITTNSETSNKAASASNSTATAALGFRPLIANLNDLLPDSSSNDPLELVPELTPSGPLQDLNDLTSFLGENLTGLMDMDVEASSNSVCIHNIGNRETSIQDALDFVTSQSESFEMAPSGNENNTNLLTLATPVVMNRVQNVGFNCTTLNGIDVYKFYCLSDRCTFLFSSEAIGLQNHLLFEHPHTQWNGYCDTCAKQIRFVTSDTTFSYTDELEHLLQVHTKPKTTQQNGLPSQTTEVENSHEPRIKLRRLSGDCLSTTTGNSNSSSNPTLISGLEDSNSFSDLIRFNPPRKITLNTDESQATSAPTATTAANDVPIEISCVSNDGVEPLFKSIGNDFQITSISSGLEPSEFSEIVRNAYQQKEKAPTNTNINSTNQASTPLQIANVVSLHETPAAEDPNANVQAPQPKINVLHKKNNQPQSVLQLLLQPKDTQNENALDTTSADANRTKNIKTPNAETAQASESENAGTPLPKITNVCSLSSNATQHRAGSLWTKQIVRERNELALSAAELNDVVNMRLANANAWRKASRIGRTPTPPCNAKRDSPEPLIVSEILPVAQATTGQFVITQTVSAQYDEVNETGSNSAANATLGFNISISAADLNLANTPVTAPLILPNITTTSIDLTADNDDQIPQQPATPSKLPPLKCLEQACDFVARHFVAMIDHIKMHDLKNDSSQREYLRCSVCTQKCLNVDDYTNHVRAKHFTNAASAQKSSVTSTSSSVMSPLATTSLLRTSSNILDTTSTSTDRAATALTEKIRNILSGKQGEATVGAATVASSSNTQSMQSSEETAFKQQLHEIIKNMVAKTGLPENKLFRCLVANCNVKLSEENYNTHVLYHLSTVGNMAAGPFDCPHCRMQFSNIPLLKKHIKDHSRHNYFCYICLETAPSSEAIAMHFAKQHNFRKELKQYELLKADNSNGGPSIDYYVVHTSQITKANVHDYGKKLIIEWQRKKAATRTHFHPNEVELLPIQAIFSRDIFCGVCQYKSKVRTNMLRHLLQHKADNAANGAANNAGGGGNHAFGAASTAKRTFMDPINPVPCLISNEKHFDRMTNLAGSSSSLGSAVQPSSSTANPTAAPAANTNATTSTEAICRLRYGFVPETKRYICGVPGCQYLTISEDIFRAHLVTLHADIRNYRCSLCNDIICKKTFSPERILQHLRYHDRTIFQCQNCDYNHYIRYLVEKHVLDKHGQVMRANLIAFIRDEQHPLDGQTSVITISAKKSRDSNASGSPANDSAISVHAANKDISTVATSSGSSLLRKQRMSIDMSTRPLWQRDDPTRIRQIRGIPMEDEADTERLRKRLRLNEDFDDDEDYGNSLSGETLCKFYLNCFEFGCFHCETKTLSLPDLRTHWLKTHSTASNCATTKPFHFVLLKQLKCAECQKFFGCHWELRSHLITAHNKTTFYAADARTKKLICAFCDYECSNTLQLQRHSQRQDHSVHDLKALTAVQMVQTMRLENDEDATAATRLTFVQCLLCNELFCSGHEVAKHAHEKHAADIERFSFREFKNTILYRCSECTFASADELTTLRHMINHYSQFKRCHFCLEPQATFNGYMQHCYSDHRSEIRRFSEIYTLVDVRKFLLQMLVLFPNGWLVDKRNLRDTPYGSGERIGQFYAEICKTSQEPPIPRLSLGRLVARKSIEAKQQQQTSGDDESGSSSTAAAMQLAGNSQTQKHNLTAKKISKRRSTVAIGNDMAGILKGHQTPSAVKRQKLSTHIVESRNKLATMATLNLPTPPKFSETDSTSAVAAVSELKPYSFYGKRPEIEETSKIFTNISFAGVNTRIPLAKFKILVQLDAHVVLEKLNIRELCKAKNATNFQITEECEVGSSSGSGSSSNVLPTNSYAYVKKACPASQKYRFT